MENQKKTFAQALCSSPNNKNNPPKKEIPTKTNNKGYQGGEVSSSKPKPTTIEAKARPNASQTNTVRVSIRDNTNNNNKEQGEPVATRKESEGLDKPSSSRKPRGKSTTKGSVQPTSNMDANKNSKQQQAAPEAKEKSAEVRRKLSAKEKGKNKEQHHWREKAWPCQVINKTKTNTPATKKQHNMVQELNPKRMNSQTNKGSLLEKDYHKALLRPEGKINSQGYSNQAHENEEDQIKKQPGRNTKQDTAELWVQQT